ncbi:unnamed protein product [Closterium sp. NIES-64]|nr:unnamed protein product [Closterium sp. NIES-64]
MARLSLALLLLLLAGKAPFVGPSDHNASRACTGLFKWGSSSVSGPKQNVALATDEAAMLACNTKSVFVELVKPKRKGVYRVALQRSAHFFFSTVGKDCAAKGMKLQYSAA